MQPLVDQARDDLNAKARMNATAGWELSGNDADVKLGGDKMAFWSKE